MVFYLCLDLYVSANVHLSKLLVTFGEGPLTETPPGIPPTSQADWPTKLGASAGFITAMKWTTSIESLLLRDIPLDMAASIAPTLLRAISCWSTLTHLSFRVALDDPGNSEDSDGTSLLTPPFPGLSFLASKIRRYCPILEELEFHFDKGLVVEEDLTHSLETCECTTHGCSGHHRLRKLRINTGSTVDESRRLDLSVSRKIKIATFLDRLFPALEVVEGSAEEVWDEIGKWVQAFREPRERFAAQVYAVLDGF